MVIRRSKRAVRASVSETLNKTKLRSARRKLFHAISYEPKARSARLHLLAQNRRCFDFNSLFYFVGKLCPAMLSMLLFTIRLKKRTKRIAASIS